MCIFRIPSLYKSKILIQILRKGLPPQKIYAFLPGVLIQKQGISYTLRAGLVWFFGMHRFLMCLKAPSKMAACSLYAVCPEHLVT